MAEFYNFFKIIHIIAFISWMVGLFYLPRLFVYHTKVKSGSEADNLFQTMELKLLRIIMNPAMIITFLTGFYLLSIHGFEVWLHIKLTLVIILAGFHGMLARWRKIFANGQNQNSEKFYRYINEVPTIILILIVTLVVTRPF